MTEDAVNDYWLAENMRNYTLSVVGEFADHMQAMILRNERNANGPGWLTDSYPVDRMMTILRQDVDELEIAVRHGSDVLDKAADVANLAMMIVDRSGGLPQGADDRNSVQWARREVGT
ncbi:MAG: hypothetical protein M3506_00375 [Chloroflexota bacterium]|nr:hypothetical protein [Chloroflexota bacterium]